MNKEQKILEKMQLIKLAETTGNYDQINQKLSKKRIGWLEKNKDKLNLKDSVVRRAYEIFLFEYLNLDPKEIPVIYEDDKKIVWRSYNWCPVLEACQRLDCDTRKVCQKGWEKSVQKFVEKIDPNLRFSRNYDNLRPYADYCEEMLKLVD